MRSDFPNAKILIAVGGWGDATFDQVSKTDQSITKFAHDVAIMLNNTGADGVGTSILGSCKTEAKMLIASQTSIGSIPEAMEQTTDRFPTIR